MKRIYPALIFAFMFVLAAVSPPAWGEGVDIHGFISQGYLKTDQNNYLAETDEGTFQFNEMGINFTSYVTGDLKLGCQFFARDLGDVGNDEIIVNWAFAEYTYKNWLSLRTGTMKIPSGLYNDLRDFDSLRTAIFLPSSVYNEWLRDGINRMKGVELFGAVDIGAAGLVEYQLLTGATQIPLESGSVKLITEINKGFENLTSIDVGQMYVARMIWTSPLDGLRLGASYIKTDVEWNATRIMSETSRLPVTFDTRSLENYTFSIEYIFKNLTVAAENLWLIRDATAYLPGIPPIDQDIDAKDSYYVRLGYRMTDWFETGYYFSKKINNPDATGDANELEDQCLSFRFDVNPNWIAKLEIHMMNGEYGVYPDDDGHTYSEWMLYAAKLSYSF